MRAESTTLVMAGAREAHVVVNGLLARGRRVVASLPEEERMFDALRTPTRLGRFKNEDAMWTWMQEQDVRTVIDASHAFDDDVTAMVSGLCTAKGIRYLRLLRPPWRATLRDRWLSFPSIEAAAASVPATARVFSNTGWLSLPDYAKFSGRRLYMRQTHSVSAQPPFGFVTLVPGSPPFSQFEEENQFAELRITHLMCRNVGGAASMSKLLAARARSLPVLMIERRACPEHLPQVETVVEALAWEADQG
ncbi:cobalt-precorrin-6A/precorrin-6x reductase [Roseobacter denitrificans]|uniref:Precorrin-6A reductase, putative n=1 Tax=Roseobacter denitrificans (strain ATCC 33942 / OCh 114) TaxID=375451 RepID=Q164A9_ROSDO|nr:precorrin-6A/cobalt-precorrin-6A reductase [Roseobacter denitrificans]ABG32684.1 precorrin-6A reductase, putative [Roseobacter denitrificans OCh 114]AVL52112.1 cobalt-precorrin-6A/precorrin-6x reductase [Roseobacter denitrificans]SFF93699.1 precorrin-6A reductase [Roseobacter denitrificans OCh 114]